MINIILVEDNAVVRNTLATLLSYEKGLRVAGTAENAESALALLAQGPLPDVMLADLNMPGMDGIELTCRIRSLYNNLHVVILTMHDQFIFAEKAFAAGARGYLLKDGDIRKLCISINKVYHGETVIDDHVSM